MENPKPNSLIVATILFNACDSEQVEQEQGRVQALPAVPDELDSNQEVMEDTSTPADSDTGSTELSECQEILRIALMAEISPFPTYIGEDLDQSAINNFYEGQEQYRKEVLSAAQEVAGDASLNWEALMDCAVPFTLSVYNSDLGARSSPYDCIASRLTEVDSLSIAFGDHSAERYPFVNTTYPYIIAYTREISRYRTSSGLAESEVFTNLLESYIVVQTGDSYIQNSLIRNDDYPTDDDACRNGTIELFSGNVFESQNFSFSFDDPNYDLSPIYEALSTYSNDISTFTETHDSAEDVANSLYFVTADGVSTITNN